MAPKHHPSRLSYGALVRVATPAMAAVLTPAGVLHWVGSAWNTSGAKAENPLKRVVVIVSEVGCPGSRRRPGDPK